MYNELTTQSKEDIGLNKAELVASIAQKSELSKKDAEAALNAFIKSVFEALEKFN